MKYVLTIIIFLMVVLVIKILLPLWRFYILVPNIIDTYEMLDAIIQSFKNNQINNDVWNKEIILKYGKYNVKYKNLSEAYKALSKQCEKAINCGDKIKIFLVGNNDFFNDMERITNIYNHIRTELWKKN